MTLASVDDILVAVTFVVVVGVVAVVVVICNVAVVAVVATVALAGDGAVVVAAIVVVVIVVAVAVASITDVAFLVDVASFVLRLFSLLQLLCCYSRCCLVGTKAVDVAVLVTVVVVDFLNVWLSGRFGRERFAKLHDFQNCHAYHEGVSGQKMPETSQEIEDEDQEKSDGNKHEVILEKTIEDNIWKRYNLQ